MIRIDTVQPPSKRVMEDLAVEIDETVEAMLSATGRAIGDLETAERAQKRLAWHVQNLEEECARERKGRRTAERMVLWMAGWIIFQAVLLVIAGWVFLWPKVIGWWAR